MAGEILLPLKLSPGMIKIGFGNVPVFDENKSRTIWNHGGGNIVFNGCCDIGHGSKIGCGGRLVFGNNFTITAESLIICDDEIVFGDDVLISWQSQIMDTDYHQLKVDGRFRESKRKISIGPNVWIGSHCIILKGVVILGESVIAGGSIVTKQFLEKNVVIAGNPAKIVRSNVTWKR